MKTAIVTGASGNLGQAVVIKFIEEGYNVIGTIAPDHTGGLNFPAGKFEAMPVDLANEEEAEKFVAAVIEKYETIEVAVLTAGGFAAGKIADTKAADISKQYKLNFETAYNIARPAFIQMLKQKSGRIFMIGSKPGLSAGLGKGMIAYSLGKSLIFRLAELMNGEAKGTNVVTTVVVPSTIDTPQNRQSMPDANFDDWVKPGDIAAAIYYYTTGEAAIIKEPVLKVYNNA
jgi:NAD(P)-dependent dehydrogenase (short-subunit alcohol dehydrogenase family)